MGAPVPFEHKFICSISHDGDVTRNTISGQAHCGMVAAADWIEQHCTSILLRALRDYPDYKVKVKIKHKALLNAAHRAITAIESHLPLVSGAKAIANHAVTSGAK
ncbi:uncharacterized protein LOC109816625 isoform X2 [Cajanus cajan]|nr:uncharacterized protein LOC109816625 isoform X2 [Cajanus cajan]